MAELRKSVGVKGEKLYEQPFEPSKTKEDIASKKDDILKKFETWFHQKHGSINIRHLYLGEVCTSREKLVKGEIVIVSVIERKEAIENEKYQYDGENLTVVYKRWGEISVLEETKKDRKHDYGKIKEIAKYLKEKENEMFEEHSNLEMIRASLFRLKTNKAKKEETISEPCIAIYCSYKGVVPVGEKEFPAEMDGFPTDIREGFFHLHVNYDIYANSKDLLDPLRMGASISRDNERAGEGTLGGFVELNDGGVGFITCAHVLFTEDEMHTRPSNFPFPTFQPSISQEGSQQCGKILRSAFPSSTIVDGDFPQVCFGRICSGREAQDHPNEQTLKCGMKSGLTLGELEIGQTSARFRNILLTGARVTTMYMSQLAIRGIYGKPFSESGDPGSLVFQFKDIDDLKCIGMIVGGDGNLTYATSIIPVLEALSVTLKTF
ncbi:uncharacterized protein LOC133189249 [Saccostrea echinata]|uniref:uncharacterized protein LOC133189249 n=1 Tax=Saccostrea echinata TaxID=191078 RepID=UPI002A83799C|nr:uncharacterized protein LOC133189249 [Saccostrea echinata]